jgi:hypothetical protein
VGLGLESQVGDGHLGRGTAAIAVEAVSLWRGHLGNIAAANEDSKVVGATGAVATLDFVSCCIVFKSQYGGLTV